MHPSIIRDGVILGVEHGGNKSGIPTVNGAIVFDNSYIGKPLVFCGTGGILPHRLNGGPTSEKLTEVGDRILMVGGRIGKDGIHGATFSSAELEADSPVSAVQIGDPITQKRMTDFLMEARDKGLISGITDNGAGGLSSSVGEMAEITNGAEIDLSQAKTKYQGLMPWELLVSESQERMTVSVHPAKLNQFNELAEFYDVEVSDLGKFTDSGYFHVYYNDETVAYLPLDFLHGGCPQLKLEAEWSPIEDPNDPKDLEEEDIEELSELTSTGLKEIFKLILSDENVRTRESVIRRFDHEVKAQTVVKPLTGKKSDAPSDAAVVRPLHDSDRSIVVSCGLNPWISKVDPYLMGAFTVDEAFRNALVVGVDPERASILDNFCWPDPIYNKNSNPDGKEKLAWLVRTCMGLRDASLTYSLPLISGKDSMKNDYKFPKGHPREGEKISVLPTLLVSLMGVMESAKLAVTSDFKKPGSALYEIGVPPKGLKESVLYRKVVEKNGTAAFGGFNLTVDPEIDLDANLKVYKKFHEKLKNGLVLSAHDVSDGGLVVAIAESCLGGRLGAAVTAISNDPLTALFSEAPGRILVEVDKENQEEFLSGFEKNEIRFIGRTNDSEFEIETADGGLQMSVDELSEIWTSGVFKWR
jgi:phosphoribosylformylglycinamidine synthase